MKLQWRLVNNNLSDFLFHILSLPLVYSSFLAEPRIFLNHPSIAIKAGGLNLIVILILIAKNDIKEMLIPTYLCRLGIVSGLFMSTLSIKYSGYRIGIRNFQEHLIASALAFLSFLFLRWLSNKIFRTEALGAGDALLSAIGGAWLGYKGISVALAFAFVSAGLIGLIGRLFGTLRKLEPYPFGPFICIGIWGVWIFGSNWWSDRWQNLLGL